jgi:hypothetical protein
MTTTITYKKACSVEDMNGVRYYKLVKDLPSTKIGRNVHYPFDLFLDNLNKEKKERIKKYKIKVKNDYKILVKNLKKATTDLCLE